MSHPLGRYARQERLPEIGSDGQRRIRAAHVLVVGCGALGSAAAELLARAGVGTLTLIDRDVVEWSNLQRQHLFDEEDAKRSLPKVEAAKARLARINSEVRTRTFFDDFNAATAERYVEGVDVILDGLDNLETRYLLNDVAVMRDIPYVYGAAVGVEGMSTCVIPGCTACLRCIFPELPPAGTIATCESAGVLGTVTALIGALEATAAIKLVVGAQQAIAHSLVTVDLWSNTTRAIATESSRDPNCPCCGQRRFEFLDGSRMSEVTVLCGKNAVQFAPPRDLPPPSLPAIEERLRSHGEVRSDELGVSCTIPMPGIESPVILLTVFADGRILVRGTRDPEQAKSLVARFVGR
jgi:molybdopterin/thiamine biosynthesis adenylyltransferase